jgi:transcriptional regulator with XRE-family HTH domain
MTDNPHPATLATALRRERECAGLSLSALAQQAGVAKSTLSQLEAGGGNPGVDTLWALATALGVPAARLLEGPALRVVLLRAGEGPRIADEQGDYVATLLAPAPPGVRRDVYRLEVQPGVPRSSPPHPRATTEHLVLCSGRARAGPARAPTELHPGDYLRYPGDEPHVFEALAPGTSAVLVLEHG